MAERNQNPPYKRIATEEAWMPEEILNLYRKEIREKNIGEPGFHSLWGFYSSDNEIALAQNRRIVSLGEQRIADMDAAGIDIAVLALSSPGVQIFDPITAHSLAVRANDELAEGIARHPDRFTGLAAFSPLDEVNAGKELERGVTKLGLKGGILNSHTFGTYLDDERYWGIFETAEALGVPIYLHPNTPSPQMLEPFLSRGLDAAVYGFSCETGLHALRLLVSGLFDRFPKLQIVLGHTGEALPFWLYRIDFMHTRLSRSNRYAGAKPLQRKASEYLRENFYYTSSGVGDPKPIMYVQDVIGADRVMYAMDYPWQYVPEETAVLDNMPVGPDVLKAFYEDNARRVFNIK